MTGFGFQPSTTTAIKNLFGSEGKSWLPVQTDRINRFIQQHELEVTGYIDGGLAMNEICCVRRGSEQFILKTGYPNPELFTEIQVLHLWKDKPGCVQLVEADEEAGILLLRRVTPGTTFRDQPVETRSTVIPNIFDEVVLSTELESFPTYEDWLTQAFEIYRDSGSDVMGETIDMAEHKFREVWHGYDDRWVLHGDLHHENMLRSDDDWIAIDPKGVVGPLVMNYGRFMHNFAKDEPLPVAEMITRRAESLAGRFSAYELIVAGFIDVILSCVWTVNDRGRHKGDNAMLVADYADLVQSL